LRRIGKVPSLIRDKDFRLFPPFIKQTVIPILGFIALVIGLSLTLINLRKVPNEVAATESTPSSSQSASNYSSSEAPQNNAIGPTTSSNSFPSSPSPNGVVNQPVNSATSSQANTPTYVPAAIPVQMSVPSPSPTPTPETVRYSTGTNLIRPEHTGGHGALRISNGTGNDAIAKLVDISTNKTSRLVYIQASTVGTITGIGSGRYTLKFSLGSGYDPSNSKFLYSQSFSQFDEILDFSVSRTADGIRWMDYEVTLNPVPGGTARTSAISQADFEDH